MAKKKDLQGAITRGADLFFSANDEKEDTHIAQEVQGEQKELNEHEAQEPYKAQDVSEAHLQAVVIDMQRQLEAQEEQRTQGRKGLKMPRMNMSFTPSNMEYLKIMAGISGITVTRYVNNIIEQDAATNAERYQKAKDLMK